MLDFGHFSLILAWLASLLGVLAGSYGAARSDERYLKAARNSVYLTAFFAVASLVYLAWAFVSHQYSYNYVWQTSNNAMPAIYLVSAIWGGMDGSMLLWAVIMSVFAAAALYRSDDVYKGLIDWVVPVMSLASNFFFFLVAFMTNPFRLVPGNPALSDGNGLNPLLQNPSMLIHPPFLYLGFTGFMIPFAFCLAALISGALSDHWIRVTRRWTLVAWGFLTIGIILGGNWAYIELGWGGFWAWDPVENSSFMPWLTGTAFLHSVMVQQQKSMLKVWNIILCVLSYALCIYGTFLTRSGIVQSVHAFAETDIGWVFLLYLAVLLLLTVVLIAYRWSELKPEKKFESYFSREASFLFNNLALIAICFVTFWGVMFPVFSEWFTGEKSVVGPPFFNKVNVPIFLFLLFLMGVGPLISWRRTSASVLRKLFLRPFLYGSVIFVLCVFLDSSRLLAALSFGLSTFVVATIFAEFHRGMKVRKQTAEEKTGVISLIAKKPRRYGGLIVHLGIAVMAVSITASMAYKIEKDFSLQVGSRYQVGNYSLELERLYQEDRDNYLALIADVKVETKDRSEHLGYLRPERRFYPRGEETTTEVDIRITPKEDLYLALAGLEQGRGDSSQITLENANATFKVFVNPLQVWLWFGSVIVLIGTVIVIGKKASL